METIFDIFFLFLVTASVWANFFFFSMLKNVKSILLDMEVKNSKLHEDLVKMDNKYDLLIIDMQKTLSNVCTLISEMNFNVHVVQKNIEEKVNKNNWDNIREAFNRPARIELNERAQ